MVISSMETLMEELAAHLLPSHQFSEQAADQFEHNLVRIFEMGREG